MLAGTFLRMTLPLAVGVLALVRGGSHEAVLLGQLAVFYLLTLSVETWLSLRLAGSTAPRVEGSGSRG